MLSELIDKVENDDPDERASKKEASSKTQGTKDGKSCTKIKSNGLIMLDIEIIMRKI